MLSALFLVFVFLTAACCSGPAVQSVASCPHCGDPHTVIGPDGRSHVTARWTVPDGPLMLPFERVDSDLLVRDDITAAPTR